jgi:hypothetical protein
MEYSKRDDHVTLSKQLRLQEGYTQLYTEKFDKGHFEAGKDLLE